ncbi:MAG: endonuclease/exonuclease/phosphatase family protein [Muribaculaceae bacterium]|nr:endonuclease/exonuclease/phosphatase family protein [Muribaculaceae bacterium]
MKLPIISPLIRMALRILSVALFLLTILSAYGGHINPRYFAMPSILTLALPYFAGATILCTIWWAISSRFVFTALGVLTILACLSPLSHAFPIGSAKDAPEGSTTFSVMTFNILHTYDTRQPEAPGNRSINFLIDSGADIICMQEVERWSERELPNFTSELRNSLFNVYPYRAGEERAGEDLKVISKYPVSLIGRGAYDSGGRARLELYRVNIKGHTLHIINVHLDSYQLSDDEREVVTEIRGVKSAKRSLAELKGSIRGKLSESFRKRAERASIVREWIDTIKGPLIVCGDFNDVPESWAYRTIRGEDLRDAYAETNLGPTYTYNEHLFLFHIDQMLYRGPIEALKVKRSSFDASDHYPLMGHFAFTD